ncbi:MAG: hypothetical protein KDA21_03525 [Phycisphaerales bacterium]|nr:hypothetical protein [Phycisphaerales bacterium]
MKRGRIIRLTFFLTTLSIGLWQAPDLIEKAVDTYGPMLGLSGPAVSEEVFDKKAPEQKPKEFVIFSPQGDSLSDEDRARLLGEARRNAPHVPLEKAAADQAAPPADAIPADIAALQKYKELLEKQ